MTMVLERVKTEGIAQLSYLIGDDESGTAVQLALADRVVQPQPDRKTATRECER